MGEVSREFLQRRHDELLAEARFLIDNMEDYIGNGEKDFHQKKDEILKQYYAVRAELEKLNREEEES